jgi:hypothetical protein
LLSGRATYLGTVVVGIPGYFILKWLRWSSWHGYVVLGAVLGLAIGLAAFWWDIGSKILIPALQLMVSLWWRLMVRPASAAVAAIAGAIEGIVFWAIARPTTRPDSPT